MKIKQNKDRVFKNQGFTLLELLVVISIIGILLAMGSVAFTTAQQKSRDAKRRADIKALRSGFEQYYAKFDGNYGSCAEMMGHQEIFPGGPPQDPKEQANYPCESPNVAADELGYCVCAELEAGGGNADSSPSPCDDPGIPGDASADDDWYCLSNLQ